MQEVIILGGGLTGLTLAHLLRSKGIEALILEARPRLGGRILTDRKAGQAPVELGATWLGRKHSALTKLLEALELKTFRQELGDAAIYEPISTSPHQLVKLPPNDDPSFRIVGGSDSLISALASTLEDSQIKLDHVVSRLIFNGEFWTVQTSQGDYQAPKVVSTLPPNLLVQTVGFDPVLPEEMAQLAKETHTWMGESIKVGLRYESPFWRDAPYSGTIMSNVGPIPEMYDHADQADTSFALKGFFNGSYHSLKQEDRLRLVMAQLRKYYGNQATTFTEFVEKVWVNEPFTFSPYQGHIYPHQNNGADQFREPLYDGTFFLAGSETADQFPGYMDGAVRSANHVFRQLTSS
ncbi:NAD(P)/FAD-dependent oxidoreductase [Pontibacter sp. G13]|uniref:flavin monoamine oxidase family protein n=1 Tax=Pontibacter sp. G13 TaxID=3074898 RepID=UPI00288C4300|nr:NAD(P)/FAD-dependent oxidoreductase [Pontibacter sp. G13]WNJ18404.1 NAD(P)/FAD-dependent oxidoreductase [Pontibacter sp. G13]